jgi:isopenicillin N synthase-like dioxygenase
MRPAFQASANSWKRFLLACQDVAQDIVTALEIGLGLPVGAFTRCMETRVDELRLNYYSPLPIEKLNGGKYKRAWPHTDFGLITLLRSGINVKSERRRIIVITLEGLFRYYLGGSGPKPS